MIGLLTALLPRLLDRALPRILDLVGLHQQGKITAEELKAETSKAMVAAYADLGKAALDSINNTYATFVGAVVQHRGVFRVWAAVTISQLAVLVWHQVGIPWISYMGWVGPRGYPSSGTTVEWAYLLLSACVGFGAVMVRSGPGAGGGIADTLKSLVVR